MKKAGAKLFLLKKRSAQQGAAAIDSFQSTVVSAFKPSVCAREPYNE